MIKVDKYYIDDSKSGGKVQFKTDCPACPDAGKQKHTDKPLSVNQLNKTYNCHRCGWHGSYEKYEEGYKNNFKSNTVEEKEFTKPTITNMTNLSQEHVDYMFLRGIKQVTLKRNKIFTGEKNGIANDWINFPYYDSEELINVKSRKSKEKKFMQVAGANHIMYKLNDIRGEKSCIISEGEIESLTWEEVGFKNGTSVSQGAPNINDQNIEKKLACVYNCFDVFESMEIIYLACDNDPNGKRLEKELIRIFGEEKVRIIDFSVYTKYNGEVCKDANDVLLTENGKTKLLEAYNNAKEIRKEGVFTANDFRNEILSDYKIGQPRGTTTYVKEVDRIYTHRRGEVNLWTGYNNDGKSLMLRYLLLLKAKYEDWKIGMYVPEDMPLAEFYTDLIEAYQGKTADRIYEHSENFMSEENLLQGLDFVDKHFYTVYPENDKTIDELLKRFSYMIRKYNLSAIVFDPYNQIEHLILNGQREDLYISTFMSKLKTFAVKHNICLHLVAHQVTPKLEKSGKFPKPNRYSIKGGGTFSDKADNVLLVWRENRNEQGDTSVTLISDKIKKRKLTGNTGETTFNFDWKKNRYIFGGYDPMESPTTIGANENVWKAITPNSMFEEITYEEQIQNTQLTDYESKGDLPF